MELMEIVNASRETIIKHFSLGSEAKELKLESGESFLTYDEESILYLFNARYEYLSGVVLKGEEAPVSVFGVRVGMGVNEARSFLLMFGFKERDRNPVSNGSQECLFLDATFVPDYYDPAAEYEVDPIEYYTVVLSYKHEDAMVSDVIALSGYWAHVQEELLPLLD